MWSFFQCPQLSELVHFLLWALSVSFYIFHRHRVCLVDRVDLICSLYSWCEGFVSYSLATLPLGFNYGFISTSVFGSSTGVCSWGYPGGLGFAPMRARCGGSTAAWVAGVLSGETLWWWGERGYGDGSPHYSWLSSINLLPWLLAFLHGHFPPQSPSSHSLDLSLHSQQQPLPWDCSTIPKLQLPATMPSRVCMAVARTVWFSFHLGCFPLSLNVSPLTQTTVRMWGSDPCFSSPTSWGQVQSY